MSSRGKGLGALKKRNPGPENDGQGEDGSNGSKDGRTSEGGNEINQKDGGRQESSGESENSEAESEAEAGASTSMAKKKRGGKNNVLEEGPPKNDQEKKIKKSPSRSALAGKLSGLSLGRKKGQDPKKAEKEENESSESDGSNQSEQQSDGGAENSSKKGKGTTKPKKSKRSSKKNSPEDDADDLDSGKESEPEEGEEQSKEKDIKATAKGGKIGGLSKRLTGFGGKFGRGSKKKDQEDADNRGSAEEGANGEAGTQRRKKKKGKRGQEEEGGEDSRTEGEASEAEDRRAQRRTRAAARRRRSSRSGAGAGPGSSSSSDAAGGPRPAASRGELGAMRGKPPKGGRGGKKYRDRVGAERVPEVCYLGELVGGWGFPPAGAGGFLSGGPAGLCCRWRVEHGHRWTPLGGEAAGQTHAVGPSAAEGGADLYVWNHPLDLHLSTISGLQGGPRIIVQIYSLDAFGRSNTVGYGFAHLPLIPGLSEINIPCWRPTKSVRDEITAFFLGVTPRLTDEDVVFSKAWDQRCRLTTLPSGKVCLSINTVLRYFEDHKIDLT